jgi:hypothetical protein
MEMRGTVLGAMLGALAILFAASPADARSHALEGNLSATGGVSVTWHGSQAGHCAAAGLCGYRGSVSTEPDGGQLFIFQSRGRVEDAFATIVAEDASIVRVSRREPDGGEEACVDAGTPEESEVGLRVRRGIARLRLAGAGLDTGRCAGPDLAAVTTRLPAPQIPLARLERGHTSIDLSARVPFTSGPFSGRVISTLRLHVGRMRRTAVSGDDSAPVDRARGRLVRVVDYRTVYRVTALEGQLSASFHGLRDPLCAPVDACGVSGVENWAILSSGGTVLIQASALARPSDHGLGGMVAAVRRRGGRGDVLAYGDLRHEVGTTSARVERSGGTSCHDTRSALPPYFDTQASRTGVVLGLGVPDLYPSGPDLLRTGCPGPTQAGALTRQRIGSGRLPLSAITARRLELPLRAGGRFDDGAYAGPWRGRFTMRLQRVKQRLQYHYARVPR